VKKVRFINATISYRRKSGSLDVYAILIPTVDFVLS